VQAKDGRDLNINSGGAVIGLMTTLGSFGILTDNSNGTYMATLTSSAVSGIATISGTINGAPITDTATVAFTFGPPANFSATAINTSQVALTWSAVSGATSYDIYRASVVPAYAFVTSVANPAHTDSGLTPDQTYVYVVRAVRTSETSTFSAPDAATMVIFTDPTLTTSIVVKEIHLTQLRTAVNAMRTAAGLSPSSFTDVIVTAGTTTIKAAHIIELRTALNAARTPIGLPPLTYTDASLTAGITMVKGVHFTQLRQGTQ
jgi:hypothetical protein